MNKRIISIFLSVVMVFSLAISAPIFAASTNPTITIEADKTTAVKGEEITYTIYLQQPDTMVCFAFNIVVAEGLTFVDESVILDDTTAGILGAEFEYTSPSETIDPQNCIPLISWISAEANDIADKTRLKVATFKCKVNEDATLNELYEVNLTNVEMMAGSTQDYADISSTIDVTPHFVYVKSPTPFSPSPSNPPSTPQTPGETDAPENTPVDTDEPSNKPFTDVAEGLYYYNPVLWAVERGVTTGTSATTFSPDVNCTRAQTVTFLWRAAGSPIVTTAKNPFSDVKAGDYFYDAVLWAVDQGITTGVSATEFAPEQMVNRGQTVTFIWRLAGKTMVDTNNVFTDVSNDAYYKDAVLWAANEGITTGTTAATFEPDSGCTRGQIVTFIYRYFN